MRIYVSNNLAIFYLDKKLSERVFSTAGNIITEKRASLTSEHINMSIVLYYGQDKQDVS